MMNEFPTNVKKYFSRLTENNNKRWFNENHIEYDNKVLEPAKEFVTLLGSELQKFAPKIIADPPQT